MNVQSRWLNDGYGLTEFLALPGLWRYVSLSVFRVALTVLITGQAMAQVVDSGNPVLPECKCRSPGGQMQELGAVQCVDIAGRKSLVRCEMSTNTPYWKTIEGVSGCPDA